jgi:hypothetical protein
MSKQLTKKHWKDFFDYKYLGSQDLVPGQDLNVKIVRAEEEKHTVHKGEKKNFLVIYFEGVEKGMIFGKTNCRIVGPMFNSNYPVDWVGKSITLYIETGIKNPNGGEPVEGLRIRDKAPKETDAQKVARISEATAIAVGDLMNTSLEAEKISTDERNQMSVILRKRWPLKAAWRKPLIDKHITGELTIDFLKTYILEDVTAAQ